MFCTAGPAGPLKGTSGWESKPAWAFMGKLLSWPACVAISRTMGLGTGQSRGHGRKIKCQRWGHGWVLDTSEVTFLGGSSPRPSQDSDSGEGKCPRGGRAKWLEAGIWARKVPPSHLRISTSPRGHSPEQRRSPSFTAAEDRLLQQTQCPCSCCPLRSALSRGLGFSPYQLSCFLGTPRRGTLYFSTEVKFT